MVPGPQPERSMSNRLMAGALLAGGFSSVVLMFTGVAIAHFTSVSAANEPHGLGPLLTGMLHLKPMAWLHLGVRVLISTPILAIFGAAVGSFYDRDWRLSVVTSILLLILMQGIFTFGGH